MPFGTTGSDDAGPGVAPLPRVDVDFSVDGAVRPRRGNDVVQDPAIAAGQQQPVVQVSLMHSSQQSMRITPSPNPRSNGRQQQASADS